ncbi:MAG TPA: hypothetical protein VF611_02700 [Pyrinomonadaceae bacterium]
MLGLLVFPHASVAQGKRAPDSNESFKNLAGPPDEMPLMRLPAAASLGLRSKAAMLPIRLRQDAAGNGVWSSNVPIDHAGEFKLTLLAPNSQDWQIQVSAGDGPLNLRHSALVERQPGEVRLDGVNFPAEVFTLRGGKAGNWKVDVVAAGRRSNAAETAGFLVVSGDSPYRLYSYLDTNRTLLGKPLEFVASVFDERTEAGSSRPEALPGSVTRAEIEIRTPGGRTETLTLNGADDRHFKGSFVPREAGQYTAQVVVRGKGADGGQYIRTGEHVFHVLADNVRLGTRGGAAVVDPTRLRLSLPASGLSVGRKVVAYAEVWGRDVDGFEAPVAWVGGMALAKEKKNGVDVDLMLDARWLARAGAAGSYELRNVRLQDPDYFVTLAESAAAIPLAVGNLPTAARAAAAEITEEMRKGKKPEATTMTFAAADFTTQALGGKLLLVHGYCTSGNPFPTSHFTNYAVFSDPNQSRSHDQFANLIRNFGSQFPSFGVVAHSQGGAASLHLYTYYWSGFDYATGNRLIQSVGTPYQGTALAGNLAAIADVFGSGCGSNYDLTYGGAAAWLAGIPSWARARVHYSTTSFTDVWWRYDYCSLATDLFLGDPEDGVTERAYGQLPGANNRGHKTGWCHTGSMRDPAQTSDSSRNADMNANAAR